MNHHLLAKCPLTLPLLTRPYPHDPHDPCAVTFGSVHDLHETHQGVLTKTFEKCFTFPVGSQTAHYPPGYTDDTGSHGPIIHVPLFHTSASSTSFTPIPLQAHHDDDMVLSDDEKHDHQYFECRIAFLCTHWKLFHTRKSLLDIKTCLEQMDARSHHVFILVPNTTQTPKESRRGELLVIYQDSMTHCTLHSTVPP